MYAGVAVVEESPGANAFVMVVVAVLVDAIDFGMAVAVNSFADGNEVFGEPNIAELKPGRGIVSARDDDPDEPHSSNDIRLANRFFR